ncbi:MAG: hypothetical protein QME32_01495 [Endomicrobiia bacterium]|nr:hypothetical protein [Endomicrobiia bacterium]
MSAHIHKQLAAGRWFELSFLEQMANIGSEVERALDWKNRGRVNFGEKAFERALELLELTIADKRNRGSRLRELLRLEETLLDYFYSDNTYSSSAKSWSDYFGAFAFAARSGR